MELRVEMATSDAVWRKFLLLLLEPIVWQETTICYLPLLRFFGSPVHDVHSDTIKKQFLPIGLRRTGPSFDPVSERDSCRSCGMGCWVSGSRRFEWTIILHIQRSVWATPVSKWKANSYLETATSTSACQSVTSLFHHCDTKNSHICSFFVWLV
jgi:hypothetical protein